MTDRMIDRAETGKFITPPSFAELPANAPFVLAFRMIELRAGSEPPPGAMARRISFGSAPTAEAAALLSGFEAIERYALQYSTDLPETCESLLASDGGLHVMRQQELALGSPGSFGTVSSRGAAAGPSGDAAALRALMEYIEGAIDDEDAYTHVLPDDALPQDLADWLARHLRRIELHLAQVADIGLAVRAVCCDMDGGRPTYGSACSTDLAQAVWRAACEAVVSWRNMVALDFNAVTAEQMDSTEIRLLHLYRGANGARPRRPDRAFDPAGWQPPAVTLARALEAAAQVSGGPVALFDMTAPELPLPVVKAVRPVPQDAAHTVGATKMD